MSKKSIQIIIKEGAPARNKSEKHLVRERFIPDFVRNIFSKQSSVRNRDPLSSNSLSFADPTTIKDSLERLMVHHFGDGDHGLVIDSLASELRRSFGARRFLNLYTQEYTDRGIPTRGLDFDWNPVPNGTSPKKVSTTDEDGKKSTIMSLEQAAEFAEDAKRHLNDTLASVFSELLQSGDFDQADDAFVFEVTSKAPNVFLKVAKQNFTDKDSSLLASWGTRLSGTGGANASKATSPGDTERSGDDAEEREPGVTPQDIEVETTPDDKLDGTSSKFAVPVFKKFGGEEQSQGAPARSLASQLMKLFPNIPKEVLMNVLKGVAKQLKGNNIKIQENKEAFVENLVLELMKSQDPLLLEKNRFIKVLSGGGVEIKAEMDKDKLLSLFPGKEERAQELFDILSTRIKSAEDTDAIERAQSLANSLAGGAQPNIRKAMSKLINALKSARKGGPAKQDAEGESKTVEPPFRPGQAIKDTVYVALYNHIIKVRDSIDLGTPTGLDAAMRVDQAYLSVFRFYRALQYLQNFLKKAKTANALDDGQAGRIIKMMPILKRFKPLNEAMIDQDAKARAKVFQSPLSVGDPESYKVKLTRLVDDMIVSIQRGMMRYPPHQNNAQVALDRAKKILSDTRKGKAGVKDPKDPGYSPTDTEIQKGSINVKQLVGPQLKAADLFDPAKDKQDMRIAKSQAAKLKTQGKDKEARTVMAKAKQKAGGAVLQRDITKVIRRFLNKQMQRIGADMSIVAENRELFEAALLEEFKNRGLIK